MGIKEEKCSVMVMKINILWFRHGLRLHDNPALVQALSQVQNGVVLLPVFIFDGESAGRLSRLNSSRNY